MSLLITKLKSKSRLFISHRDFCGLTSRRRALRQPDT
nr:MAG TPA: hypothetical protein [Caudoviricetes sp.]